MSREGLGNRLHQPNDVGHESDLDLHVDELGRAAVESDLRPAPELEREDMKSADRSARVL